MGLNKTNIQIFNDANFKKAIQMMCKHMFGEVALEDKIKWLEKAIFPSDSNSDEIIIKRLQEINENLKLIWNEKANWAGDYQRCHFEKSFR